ncbi:hypothetical protein PsorP6_000277 [Peronosclerospora sorghi]|uniref:Uncharacterized protein n=1 Tax=Peronosclerospora sorghi TaxID=230839 RepID=A0ACC0WRB7_9STRA|nr:hypothetical protein PsorP6_000277 [Peronosclerospora sorghi]
MQNNNKNVSEFSAYQPETVASGTKRPCKLTALLQRDQKLLQRVNYECGARVSVNVWLRTAGNTSLPRA